MASDSAHDLPPGDYVSPNLKIVRPDAAFPNMVVGDPRANTWPFLRREIPHNWYVDRREPAIGFLSRDEVSILYNTALMFQGRRALEIGCWLGWSACHLALAGVHLDVIDPLLHQGVFSESVMQSLQAAGLRSEVRLVAGSSPQAVVNLSRKENRRWSLLFIDGDHTDPGPLLDAVVCESAALPDAMVVFHDLASPDVGRGLDYFRNAGWQTLVYQTMQVMGVAYRGDVSPVEHHPDPKVKWELPQHLKTYRVSE